LKPDRRKTGCVWDCGSDGGSKWFVLRNALKWSFFYFKKIIFDISTSKRSENIKKIHFKQKKSKIKGTRFAPRSQTCLYLDNKKWTKNTLNMSIFLNQSTHGDDWTVKHMLFIVWLKYAMLIVIDGEY
jgi:hypothetical protein